MLRRKTLAAGALAAGCLLAAQGAAAAPPGDVSAQLHGGTLTVRGGDDVDLVGIRARGLAIDVTAGDDASAGRFPLWAVRRIRVETGAGDDRVTLDDGPLALLRFTPVTIDGGDGYDVAGASGSPGGQDTDVDAYGGDAVLDRHRHDAGIRLRATEQLTAATGAGHDAVHVGQVGELLLQLDLDLGADGRTDQVTVDGTDGPDQFDAFGSTSVLVSGPTFVQLLGAGPDDRLTLDGGAGDDELNTSLTDTQIATTLRGGPGDDTFLGGAGADRLVGGGGGDFAQGRRGADAIDLGADNDIVRWDAGDGGDAIRAGAGTFDALVMWGGPADETFALEPAGHDARMTADSGVLELGGLERVETVAQVGADAYHLGDLTGTGVTDVIVSLSGVPATPALDGAVDAMTVDGTDGDDALAIAGNTSEARVTGLPVRLAIQRTEPADTLAIAGRGGADALDASGLLPGAISARLTD